MNRINEFLEPGVYRHHKGGEYVVTDVVTHMDDPVKGWMERLADPLVIYHDVDPQKVHKTYARPLSEFKGMTQAGVKRFEIT